MYEYDYQLEPVCSLKYIRAGSDFMGQRPRVKMFGYLAR